jgi:ketosteroid isomerase-like protein
MTMQNADQLALIDRYLGAYNGFDVEAMLAVLSPDVRFENYSGGELTAQASGIEEFRRLAEQSTSIFAEREQRIAELESGGSAEGDTITARIDFHGRLAIDIPGGPAAGTVLDLRGESAFTFKDGLIASIVDRS